uniref:Uncharacterized protein n=1 Tax=Kuenenia stuttgartiensis TaxID=174633 RepID=Q1Q4C5_KUEST|nr:unknown protein [Candidatus Kuenenia stuttgartiensis]
MRMDFVSIPYRCNETHTRLLQFPMCRRFQFLIGAMRLIHRKIHRPICFVSIPYRCNETLHGASARTINIRRFNSL